MRFSTLFVRCVGLSLLIDSIVSEEEQCGLYLAVSSTSTVNETKWGLYAGKDIDTGGAIGYPEVAVNLINVEENARYGDDKEAVLNLLRSFSFIDENVWTGMPAGAQMELNRGTLLSAIPSVGFLVSKNPVLTNADWNHTAALTRPAWNEEAGVSHPGRGAYSNFFNVALRATTKISAGREIFFNFEGTDKRLRESDYERLDEMIAKMDDFFKKYKEVYVEESIQLLYDYLVNEVIKLSAGETKGKIIKDALPSSPHRLEEIAEKGGSFAHSQPAANRKLDWVQENGMCVDHIKPGPSTIPNAGRGAFATRKIKKGRLISPIPLMHLPVKEVVDMHDLSDKKSSDEAEVVGQQLLLNYCFGHPQSSMLFFPGGAISALINHDSKKANAKLVWSKHPEHHSEWFEKEPQDLLQKEYSYPGLVLEVVATKEIQKGEEVFLDYGKEWEDAWKEHKRKWDENIKNEKIPKEWPLTAIDMNEMYQRGKDENGEGKKFKLPEELRAEPYPTNVILNCFAYFTEQDKDYKQNGLYVRKWALPDGEDAPWVFNAHLHLFECEVIARETEFHNDNTQGDKYVYTVERKLPGGGVDAIVKDVPHAAFVFMDLPETGDQFKYSNYTFRHYIGIPDSVFPKGPWRNLA